MKYDKLRKLKRFIRLNSNAPIQGSAEWLKNRMSSIGGSEMSSIVGCNPFSNIESLVAQKVGLTSFNGSSATRWGNLFENVSELLFNTFFIEHDLKLDLDDLEEEDKSPIEDKIYATGGIENQVVTNHKYSPDGLCVIRFYDTYKTTLLEFKSPYSSIPSKAVPKHYLPQVKAGLCTIDLAETAVFVNNMFRKCSLNQLDFGLNYDTKYHKDTEVKMKDIHDAIANGLILLYIAKEDVNMFYTRYEKFINKKVDTYLGKSQPPPGYESDSDDSDNEFITRGNEYVDLKGDGNESELSEDSEDSDADDYHDIKKRFMCDDGSDILHKIYSAVDAKKDIRLEKLIDFGKMDKFLFDQFLEIYKNDAEKSFISLRCIKPQINRDLVTDAHQKTLIVPDEFSYIRETQYLDKLCKKYNSSKILEKFSKQCDKKGDILVGYLPWKLLRSSNIVVEKDPDYLINLKDKIDDTVEIIKDINSYENPKDKVKKFSEYYKDSKLIGELYEKANAQTGGLKEFCL
jgi:hypothetical protein